MSCRVFVFFVLMTFFSCDNSSDARDDSCYGMGMRGVNSDHFTLNYEVRIDCTTNRGWYVLCGIFGNYPVFIDYPIHGSNMRFFLSRQRIPLGSYRLYENSTVYCANVVITEESYIDPVR